MEKLLTLPGPVSAVLLCTLAALDKGQREAHAQGPSDPQAGRIVLLHELTRCQRHDHSSSLLSHDQCVNPLAALRT